MKEQFWITPIDPTDLDLIRQEKELLSLMEHCHDAILDIVVMQQSSLLNRGSDKDRQAATIKIARLITTAIEAGVDAIATDLRDRYDYPKSTDN